MNSHVFEKYLIDLLECKSLVMTSEFDKTELLRLPQRGIIVYAFETEDKLGIPSDVLGRLSGVVFEGRDLRILQKEGIFLLFTNIITDTVTTGKEESLRLGRRLQTYIGSETGHIVNVGISHIYNGQNYLVVATQEARTALSDRFFTDAGTVIHIGDICGIPLANAGRAVISYIEAADIKGVCQELDVFFEILVSRTRNSLQLHKKLTTNLLVQIYSFLCSLAYPVKSEEIQTIFAADQKIRTAPDIQGVKKVALEYIAGAIRYLHTVRFKKYETMVTRAVGFMVANYQNDIGVADVAEDLDLSPDYFSSIFRNYTGRSFTNYLTEIRMDAAKELLRSPDLSIGDIAVRCGVNDAGYFTKLFKKETGMTPSDYRTSLK